jgi:Fur family transcriptional regulator, ferric uptake regulator
VVWDVLTSTDRHLNAHEITDRVRVIDHGINMSSVYRTLTLFSELELVRESRLDDDASTWEVAHGDEVIHLRCDNCGDVRHHDAAFITALRKQLLTQTGFHPQNIDVRVTGRCDACFDELGERQRPT